MSGVDANGSGQWFEVSTLAKLLVKEILTGESGEMYRQYFCSGLSMVIAVNVGHFWELLRLSCLRWQILGTCQDAGWWDVRAAAGRQLRIALTLAAARFGPGALRGRSPRTREGRRPDRPNAKSEERENFARLVQGSELTVAE